MRRFADAPHGAGRRRPEEFRASARALLELQGFEVVAVVEDGEAALDAVERLRPDLVLLDVQLPGMDGFEVAERLASSPQPLRVVLISSRRRRAYEARLPSAPVVGFPASTSSPGRPSRRFSKPESTVLRDREALVQVVRTRGEGAVQAGGL